MLSGYWITVKAQTSQTRSIALSCRDFRLTVSSTSKQFTFWLKKKTLPSLSCRLLMMKWQSQSLLSSSKALHRSSQRREDAEIAILNRFKKEMQENEFLCLSRSQPEIVTQDRANKQFRVDTNCRSHLRESSNKSFLDWQT